MSLREQRQRANSMRGRHHVTPQWKSRVRDLFLRDLNAKTVAIEVGMADTSACRWAHALGFRLMYVTDDERRHLMQLRASKRTNAVTP